MGQLVFQATLGGQVNLVGPNTASTFNINVPAVAGNMVTTGDTGTVTNTMLAGSIANAKLSNSSITIGSTSVALGATAATVAGLTLTNPTINGFTGDTSVINVGSGQFYKDASGNVGIGTSSPAAKLHTSGSSAAGYVGNYFDNTASNGFVRLDLRIGSSAANGTASVKYAPGVFMAIGPDSNDTTTPLVFLTKNATERARIDSSGNLLVGTTSATSLFTVKAQANSYANGIATVRSGATDWWSMLCSTSTNLYFGYNNLDRAYINSSTGSFNAVSDSRLKKNIVDIQYGLQAVLDLHPVAYNMNDQEDTDEKALGFIAQEALEVVPESVSEMMGGMYGMDKVSLIPVLVKAIQEQQAIIASLTQRIETLEAK